MTETVTSLATDGEPALTPREWPEPARGARCYPFRRRSPLWTHSGPLSLAAGTALDAPVRYALRHRLSGGGKAAYVSRARLTQERKTNV